MNWLLISVLIGQAIIIDGDTLRIDNQSIRIWGLDAPEINTQRGIRAREAMQRLVGGKEVICEPDGTVSFNRVVAKCFVDGEDIAARLIEMGLAKPYCRFSGHYYNDAAVRGGKKQC
jgi:micrococcal nuclease